MKFTHTMIEFDVYGGVIGGSLVDLSHAFSGKEIDLGKVMNTASVVKRLCLLPNQYRVVTDEDGDVEIGIGDFGPLYRIVKVNSTLPA